MVHVCVYIYIYNRMNLNLGYMLGRKRRRIGFNEVSFLNKRGNFLKGQCFSGTSKGSDFYIYVEWDTKRDGCSNLGNLLPVSSSRENLPFLLFSSSCGSFWLFIKRESNSFPFVSSSCGSCSQFFSIIVMSSPSLIPVHSSGRISNMGREGSESWVLGGSLPVENVQALASNKPDRLPDRYIRTELELQHSELCLDAHDQQIPVIDLSRLLTPHCSEDELKKLDTACQEWGFFHVN